MLFQTACGNGSGLSAGLELGAPPPKDAALPPAAPKSDQTPPPGKGDEVSVALKATDLFVRPGDSTTLNWETKNADSCKATGGWNGERPARGRAQVKVQGASQTFTLTCRNASSSAVSMVTLKTIKKVALRWKAPKKNTDGSPLKVLRAFNLYYGTASRDYGNLLEISDEKRTSVELELPVDTYYFAMTAVDGDGLESDYSNEIVRRVR